MYGGCKEFTMTIVISSWTENTHIIKNKNEKIIVCYKYGGLCPCGGLLLLQ